MIKAFHALLTWDNDLARLVIEWQVEGYAHERWMVSSAVSSVDKHRSEAAIVQAEAAYILCAIETGESC